MNVVDPLFGNGHGSSPALAKDGQRTFTLKCKCATQSTCDIPPPRQQIINLLKNPLSLYLFLLPCVEALLTQIQQK